MKVKVKKDPDIKIVKPKIGEILPVKMLKIVNGYKYYRCEKNGMLFFLHESECEVVK